MNSFPFSSTCANIRDISGCGAAGSARGSGLRGRRFKSDHPDHTEMFLCHAQALNRERTKKYTQHSRAT